MSTVCVLGTLDIADYLMPEPDFGAPVREWDVVAGAYVDIATQRNIRTNALVEVHLPMKVVGTDADDLIDKLSTLRAECRKTTNTLTVGHGSSVVVFNIVDCPHVSLPWDRLFALRNKAVFELTLIREPWAYGASETALTEETFSFPDGLTFRNIYGDAPPILGEMPTPLTITLEANVSKEMHPVYIGWTNTDTWSGYLVETDTAGTWVGGTVAAGPSTYASGEASCQNTGETYSYYPIDTADFPADTYLVLARLQLEDETEVGTLKLSTSGGDLTDEVTFDPDDQQWELVELGQVRLPAQEVASGLTAYLRVNMHCTADHYIAMDYVAFVPLDSGLCCFHPSTATTLAETLRFEWGKTYVDGVLDYSGASGHGIKALGPGTLVVVADTNHPILPTYTATVTVTHAPRFEMWGAQV